MEEDKEKSNDFTSDYRGIRDKHMKKVIEQSKQLNIQIKQSAEYQKYIDTKRVLYDNIELYNQLREFRNRNNAIQTKQVGDIFDEMNALLREYDELLHNSIVSDFMNAEQGICKMMQQMYDALAEGLEFDY